MNVNYNQHSHELVEPDLVEVEDFKVKDDEYDYEEHRRRVGGEVEVPIPLVVPLSVPEIVNKKQQERFPIVLMKMINENSGRNLVEWSHDGMSFAFCKNKESIEANNFLKNYFISAKYTSLRRKLNRWGFRSKVITFDSKIRCNAYAHPLFQRDAPSLAETMNCRADGGSTVQVVAAVAAGGAPGGAGGTSSGTELKKAAIGKKNTNKPNQRKQQSLPITKKKRKLPITSSSSGRGTPKLTHDLFQSNENELQDVPRPSTPDLDSLRRLSPIPFEAQDNHGDNAAAALALASFDYNVLCDFGLIDHMATQQHHHHQPSLPIMDQDAEDVAAMGGFNPSSYPPYQEMFPDIDMSMNSLTFNGEDICHSPVTKREEA